MGIYAASVPSTPGAHWAPLVATRCSHVSAWLTCPVVDLILYTAGMRWHGEQTVLRCPASCQSRSHPMPMMFTAMMIITVNVITNDDNDHDKYSEPRYSMSNLVILNRIGFPLNLPLFFQSFTMGYFELGYLKQPAISNCFSLPLAHIKPSYLKLCYVLKNTGQRRSGSAVKAPPDKMLWKLRNVFMFSWWWNQSQTDWTSRYKCIRQQVASILLISGIKLLLQIFDAVLAISNPTISNFFSIPLRVRDSGVLLYSILLWQWW